MPVYQYQAVCEEQKIQGYITSDTAAGGRARLRNRGLRILQFSGVESSGQGSLAGSLLQFNIKRRYAAINEFTRYLGMLLRTGVPLSEALNVIIRQMPRDIEPVLRRLSERVCEGAELAQAMAQEAKYFDLTYVGIVRIGQASGKLEECLDRLLQMRTRHYQLHQRIRAALAYPATVAVVGFAVILFLMAFVVPRITWVLKQSGRELPVPTKILLFVSNGVMHYWWVGITLAIVVAVVLRSIDKEKRIKKWLNLQILHAPVLGGLIMKADIAQTAVMLETMLRSGLPLDEALKIVLRSIKNVLLEEEFRQMTESLQSGRPLIDLSQRKTVLPPVAAHILTVGEQTGQLEETLKELAQSYDNEVEIACRQAISMLEPILIVVMGCVVGFIVLSTILPILRISGSL